MNIDYKLIGARIKDERKKKNLTQEILAEKLNVSIGYVSQVERGITKISLDLLGAISSVLDCDVAELIAGSAVCSNNYLKDELINEIMLLNGKKKRILLDFVRVLSES